MALRLLGVGAPDDALVQVGDPEAVVLGVVLEQDLIEALGHVVDRAGAGRVEDLLADGLAVERLDLHGQVALGDGGADRRVAVDAHGAEVDEVGVELGLDQRRQEVVGAVDVVADRVDLVAVGLHRVGRGALLGEVDDRVGADLGEPLFQPLVVLGDVEQVEADAAAGLLVPDAGALLDRVHRRQRLHAELGVDPAAREVVDDVDLVALVGEVQGGGPAAEAVPAENRDLHGRTPSMAAAAPCLAAIDDGRATAAQSSGSGRRAPAGRRLRWRAARPGDRGRPRPRAG